MLIPQDDLLICILGGTRIKESVEPVGVQYDTKREKNVAESFKLERLVKILVVVNDRESSGYTVRETVTISCDLVQGNVHSHDCANNKIGTSPSGCLSSDICSGRVCSS